MLKLDIQQFGGRGANSGNNSKWSSNTNPGMANVMSKIGISEKQYKENVNLGNLIYMTISGRIADNYEKETGIISNYVQTKEYANYVENYNVKSLLDNDLKDRIKRIQQPSQKKIVNITSANNGSKYIVFNNHGINKEFKTEQKAKDYIKKSKLKLWR